MKHQIGNWVVTYLCIQIVSMDITMAWKTSCKDVATRVGSFCTAHYFLLGPWGATAPPTSLPPSNDAPAGLAGRLSQAPYARVWRGIWGLLTCKNRVPYNLYCVGGDVKHCSLTGVPPFPKKRLNLAYIRDWRRCNFPLEGLTCTVSS